jgi:secondary thiamine-phosphate synthase enzyme
MTNASILFQSQFTVQTQGHRDMHDITEAVLKIVEQSRIRTGIAHVFNVGSTAAVGTIEFEPGLRKDLPELLDRLIPPSPDYGHEQTWHDGNGHSHLQATWLGPAITIPVTKGRPILGTWQQVFHLECDVRPRQRTIVVTVIGATDD